MKDRVIDNIIIQQYLDGKLDPREMHELEKQSLEDEFLADALEGYTYVIEPAQKLSILQQRLADRIMTHEADKKAFSISANRLSIAAASGLMCILAAILFWMNGNNAPEANKSVQVDLVSAPVTQSESTIADGIQTAEVISRAVVSPVFALAGQSWSRSEPVKGWDEYTKYIQSNLSQSSIPLHGSFEKLIISFKVDPKGVPANLKVVNDVSGSYAENIIRLIENGPLWKPVDTDEVRIQIDFKK